jgi:signal transduction histidine kinase
MNPFSARTQIEQLQQELAQERQRNASLETALQEAQWAAEAAQRTKKAVIANLSHELHTPLNTIIGFADLVYEDLSRGDNPQAGQDVLKIKQAGLKLLSMVNEMLDLARLESDTAQVQMAPFRLEQEVARAVAEVRQMAVLQGNELLVQIAPEVAGELWGDGGKVRQVLTHLLDNGVKFTVGGTVRVEATAVVWQNQPAIYLAIHDTGIGIPAEKQTDIFDTFTQLDPSSTRHYAGTGLGLYLCKRLVELMGGQIGVQSSLGQGSTFYFYLPRHLA